MAVYISIIKALKKLKAYLSNIQSILLILGFNLLPNPHINIRVTVKNEYIFSH